MEKIECNIVYKEGKNGAKAKFSFFLQHDTPIIENPDDKTAAVVLSGTPYQTDLNYKDLIEKQKNLTDGK